MQNSTNMRILELLRFLYGQMMKTIPQYLTSLPI